MKSIVDPRYLEMVTALRAYRERQGLSQKALSTRLGRPQSYIAKIETCERRLDLLEALLICETMGITLAEIVPVSLQRAVGNTETTKDSRNAR